MPVTFNGERLTGVQGIMDSSHFGVDEKGYTVIMGFGSISFLPESFACYTLHCTQKFTTLPRTLAWSGASNMTSMVAIAHTLGMTADPRLGVSTLFLSLRGREVSTDLRYNRPDKGEDVNKKARAKRRKRGMLSKLRAVIDLSLLFIERVFCSAESFSCLVPLFHTLIAVLLTTLFSLGLPSPDAIRPIYPPCLYKLNTLLHNH